MATVPPPPSKRQKTAAAARAKEQQDITEHVPEGSVRIRFVDQATGQTGSLPVISVPLARASTKNLETLLNGLQEHGDEQIPYRFFYSTANGGVALGDRDDVYRTLIASGKATTETEISLQYTPQAVFRVRAVSRCSAAVSGHGEAILAIQFSPTSSSRVASGAGDGSARIWDCDTGTIVYTLKGHKGWVLAVSWSPDGSILATGGSDSMVRLWDPATGKELGGPMKAHKKPITNLSWEPYHKQESGRPRFASSSQDSTVVIWDAVRRKIDFSLTGHKDSVKCVKWGGTGSIYTASHDKTVKVWDATNGQLQFTLNSHAHWVNHLALSTDFAIRTAYHDHTRKTPATEEEKVAKAKERFEKAARVGGQITERLVTASDDCTVFLWSPSVSQKPVARLTGHQKQVNHVTFSPDGAYIASAGFDNHVKLWSGRDGSFISSLRGHVASVYQCCFSADSRLLVSSSKDTTLKAWDVRTGKIKEDLPGHKDEVYAVDWSPDGEKVASGGADKQVRIWRH
ncbi:F-box/WD repeat-containing protein pof1 [Pseudovirgaria hyperparasitica]|uniref:Ribosome assembly protein 4 n=1 Tax=Pseudovirgaria hyperparasitica TaxID=470096 RepID=A0A6A6WBJ0_9PEZI|nr:F-box/WD repeat-containing protein pof1 [Pseudovirgaria hyperparasitica]KAF2759206.1 F-box/WD repeat-containing protein pof1 [Pseudovirgaria hyperparasitica]